MRPLDSIVILSADEAYIRVFRLSIGVCFIVILTARDEKYTFLHDWAARYQSSLLGIRRGSARTRVQRSSVLVRDVCGSEKSRLSKEEPSPPGV